jgi:glycosyltransferase involved in cell wall biosynthesis
MKKILFFTHNIFTRENPEGYRIHQYFPYLEKIGFEIELLTTKEKFMEVLGRARSADVVYLQRLLPNPLKFSMLRKCAKKLVYDFDDAVMYGTKGESRTRRSRFARVIRSADAVFCGNKFLCDEAGLYRKDGIYYVPTVVDVDEYPVKSHVGKTPIVAGWIGSGSTSRYLHDIMGIFEHYAHDGKVAFKFVADKPPDMEIGGMIFEKWNKDREKLSLLDFDLGMMPVRDDIWSRGKCGLKLIQYMATGLPSLTHPVGVAREMIDDGVTGFLREDLNGWKDAIDELSGDVNLRKRMGNAAREYADDKFSLKSWGPRVSEIINIL